MRKDNYLIVVSGREKENYIEQLLKERDMERQVYTSDLNSFLKGLGLEIFHLFWLLPQTNLLLIKERNHMMIYSNSN